MEAISKLPPPINVSEVWSFLGLVGYYRRFVKKFSDKAAPLNALLHEDQAWKWTQECQYAFETLKGEIAARPVSAYPDFSKPFRLYTDASNLGLGAILAQKQEGKEKIICCASRTLNNAETNYSTTKKECLAIVLGVQVFRPFLVATHFEILTDHYALQWLRSMKSTSAILHRWAAALEDYRFTIIHRPGKLQGHVDALSRLPIENLAFTLEGKIRVPEEKAEAIITEVHRQGHLGKHKTWKAFNRKYYTPQGKQRCREAVRTCPECQLGKNYKARHVPKGHINSPGPWETVRIDIAGPLPVNGKSNRYIVTMMDVYSRYLIATPVRNHRASAVSRCLYESVVAYFGAPRSILSDRGTEFTGMIWESLTQMLGAKIKLTSPYYPQGNSVIEKSHRTLSNMLRTMLLEKRGRDWSSLLPSVMLYMNSMIQEKTGVSACEILFDHNPNLPSDISFTPVPSLSNDRESYIKQLKRDLKDIRQKLSRVLGQDSEQSDNPFLVGDKVIIAILPHENANKLMAKWKGPFTITKIPNRFQIEYLDGSVTRLTDISYAKKYNERCHYTEPVGVPRQMKGSCRRPRARMARLRLIAGTGNRRMRRVVNSIKNIREKWPVHSGRIRVRILGEAKDLPSDLQAVVEATGPDNCIEGSVLVDLCRQRSGRKGSGCDAPRTSAELPTPMASSPMPPTLPAVQVRQYSWRHDARQNECLYDKRREFVGKQTNHVSLLLPQQAPLVSRAQLMSVVRKVKKSERSKCKLLQDGVIKCLHQNHGKNITSLSFSRQKPERISQQYSVIRDNAERSNAEMNQLVHASHDAYDRCTLKSSKARKEKEEVKFKCSGWTNDDVIESDGIEHDNDVTIRDTDVNKPIARKHYAQKHSFVAKKGFVKSLLRMCSQTFTKIAFIFAIVISIFGGLRDIKLLERKSPIGTSPSPFLTEPRVALCFRDALILSNLRESTVTITSISEGLCSCIHKGIFLDNNKQLIRYMRILQNAITYEKTFCSLSGKLKLAAPYLYLGYATYELATFSQNVSAGKRLVAYIFPFVDFWAFRVYYLDTYTVNLELDDNFKVFYALVYLYIFPFYHSWSSCNWAIYSSVIFHTLVYFSLNWIVSVIRIHDKYQSLILIRLALTEKASSRIQCILFHFRSYWRGH